jgi:hypothetical protein
VCRLSLSGPMARSIAKRLARRKMHFNSNFLSTHTTHDNIYDGLSVGARGKKSRETSLQNLRATIHGRRCRDYSPLIMMQERQQHKQLCKIAAFERRKIISQCHLRSAANALLCILPVPPSSRARISYTYVSLSLSLSRGRWTTKYVMSLVYCCVLQRTRGTDMNLLCLDWRCIKDN